MKLLQWFGKMFNFGAKYRKQEEAYHNESKRRGPVGHLLTLIGTSAIPLLSLWGAFMLPWSNNWWILKIFCIALCFTIVTTPTELFILGVVALRHRIRMRVQNKVEDAAIEGLAEAISGKEMSEEAKKEMQAKKARGTQDKMDLIIGILGIVMSVIVFIAFIVMFFLFCANAVNKLN